MYQVTSGNVSHWNSYFQSPKCMTGMHFWCGLMLYYQYYEKKTAGFKTKLTNLSSKQPIRYINNLVTKDVPEVHRYTLVYICALLKWGPMNKKTVYG